MTTEIIIIGGTWLFAAFAALNPKTDADRGLAIVAALLALVASALLV